MKVNINTRAKVTLTARGAEILNDYNRRFHISGDYRKDEQLFPTNYVVNDTYEDELWSMMHIFGVHIHMGISTVFLNNEIELLNT